jgi:Outer membrane protein beta-barrel domain
MKSRVYMMLTILFLSTAGMAQFKLGVGVKAGVNFANVTNASSISSSNRAGFLIGGFLNPGNKGLIGFRSELIFSRQGYDFKKGTTTGSATLDYILLPQLLTLNFGKSLQLQVGGQASFLINGKVDSTAVPGAPANVNSVLSYFNRFDYGFAGGIELSPYKGFLLGARYNASLSKLFKADFSDPTNPSFVPPNLGNVDPRNNIVQLYLGYKF